MELRSAVPDIAVLLAKLLHDDGLTVTVVVKGGLDGLLQVDGRRVFVIVIITICVCATLRIARKENRSHIERIIVTTSRQKTLFLRLVT